jgi:hypothetical protein
MGFQKLQTIASLPSKDIWRAKDCWDDIKKEEFVNQLKHKQSPSSPTILP